MTHQIPMKLIHKLALTHEAKMKIVGKPNSKEYFTETFYKSNPRGELKQLSNTIFIDLDGVVFNKIMVDGQAAYISKYRVCLERL